MLHKFEVQELLSSQAVGPVFVQMPAWQLSPVVQALLSLQVVPVWAVNLQPLAASQLSVVQGLLSLQVMLTPWQALPWHLSPVVHNEPSLQVWPSRMVVTQPLLVLQL